MAIIWNFVKKEPIFGLVVLHIRIANTVIWLSQKDLCVERIFIQPNTISRSSYIICMKFLIHNQYKEVVIHWRKIIFFFNNKRIKLFMIIIQSSSNKIYTYLYVWPSRSGEQDCSLKLSWRFHRRTDLSPAPEARKSLLNARELISLLWTAMVCKWLTSGIVSTMSSSGLLSCPTADDIGYYRCIPGN